MWPEGARMSQVPWAAVYDRLTARDSETLSADELDQLADAAFWLGKPRAALTARRKAYARYRADGHTAKAAHIAWRLFYGHFDLDESAAASGWLMRAHRHASEAPDPVEAGYVALADADWSLHKGKVADAAEHARRAADIGRQVDDRDLEALGLGVEGRALIVGHKITAGLDRLDEGMVAAVSNELSPFATGWVYCLLLSTCQELGDVRRAAEWTDLAVAWSEENGQESWYPGLCHLHRCEVQTQRGDWTLAEREAVRVAEELAPFGDYLIAEGQYLAGEIRRRMGDDRGAEAAYRRAHEHGGDPQPGLALLRLSHGDATGAAASLRMALERNPGGHLRRGRLLLAHVKATLQSGDLEAASRSGHDLAALAAESAVELLTAMSGIATGSILITTGEVTQAVPMLRQACEMCRDLSCPYETAEVHELLGQAARQSGDDETARLEFDTAKVIYERLGAAPDVVRVSSHVQNGALPGRLTRREAEVIQQVALGLSNREVGAALFISEHTVARHISNIFRKLDLTSRAGMTSYAHEHHLA